MPHCIERATHFLESTRSVLAYTQKYLFFAIWCHTIGSTFYISLYTQWGNLLYFICVFFYMYHLLFLLFFRCISLAFCSCISAFYLYLICSHKIKKSTFIVLILSFIAPGFVFDIFLFSILSLLLFYFYLHICCINIWGLCVLYCVFLFYFLYLHFYKILL